MIKGVNKKIIEINNPDSLYFEKAILYIRPNVTILPETISQNEAQRILSTLIPDKKEKKNLSKQRKKLAISVIGVIAIIIIIITLQFLQ